VADAVTWVSSGGGRPTSPRRAETRRRIGASAISPGFLEWFVACCTTITKETRMRDYLNFYIDGQWVAPATPKTLDVVNPATEAVAGRISMGSAADVDRAVKAARRAFDSYSQTPVATRVALLEAIIAEYQKRYADMAAAITEEMGAPAMLSQKAQAAMGIGHLQTALSVLKNYHFEEQRGTTLVRKEAIGVCAFITPWNWPVNQIACKVAPALAVGCTMVLKPSEIAPFSAQVWTEILHAAGVPAGVFNLVNGDGPTVGAALSSHPEVDMVSFTGSTRAGIEVARNAAPTVKRVHQELGGKSPNIILPDADLKRAVTAGVRGVMNNSGQSCNAPTRCWCPTR
jgi:aldehyde dehydrogenase (NAD+)